MNKAYDNCDGRGSFIPKVHFEIRFVARTHIVNQRHLRMTGPRWGVRGAVNMQSVESPSRPERLPRSNRQLRKPSTRRPRQSHHVAKQLKTDQPSQQTKQESLDFSRRFRVNLPLDQVTQQPSRLPKTQQQQQQRPRSCRQQSQEHLLTPRRALRLSQLTSQPLEKSMQAVQEVVRPSLERTLSQSLGAELMECDQGPIELSPARHREIMSSVYKSLENVRTSRVPGDSNLSAWKVKLHKRNVAYYVDKTSFQHGQTRCCAVGYTHATVDKLVGLFLPAEKRAMLQNTRILFDNVVDADVVSSLRSPTKERPMSSVYVRRVNCQTSGPWSSRETYAIVATDVIPQSDGSTVGYCLWESIDNQDIAQAVRTTSFRHPTSFRSGFYFRQPGTTESASGDSTQGQTEIVYMVGIESGVWATSRFALEKHGSSVRRLCSHVRHKHLNPSTFVTKMQWESKCSAKSCGQCDKRFHMLSNRVNCHACGHVVCRSCTSKEPMALHVCFGCLKKAGLPAPASAEKMQLCERQRRVLSSSTTKTFEQSSIAVVYTDVNDNDGVDTGEWAISTVGIPIQLSRKNAVCV